MRPVIDPMPIIDKMIELLGKRYDIIVGVAPQARSKGYRIIRQLSNRLLHSIGYHIPKNSTPVRGLTRRAINAITQSGQQHRQFMVRVASTGYPATTLNYELACGTEKKTVITGIKQCLQLMIFNSTKPLRLASILGIAGSLFSLIFALYSIMINLIKKNVVEGWTTMVFFTSFLFMILFAILSFMGEYLARILTEHNQQKKYYISEERTSCVMLDVDRYNVMRLSAIEEENNV